ncbi:MAG: hypothetical protein ACR2KX_08245 [Chitinophagaceae bacterium]
MEQDIQALLESLKTRTKNLERQVKFTTSFLLSIVSILLFFLLSSQTIRNDKELKVRRLVIVDAKGKERIVIGSPIPDPMINGKTIHRRNVVSAGIQFKDPNGTERGGIASLEDGSFVVGIDDSILNERAHLYFLPNKGSGLLLGNPDSKDYISLLVPSNYKQQSDTPRITIEHDGKTISVFPSSNMMVK